MNGQTPIPDMEQGKVYCMECDADLLLPRIGPDHVSKRFMSTDEIRHTDIFFHGEQTLHAYEVLDGQWAIVGAYDRLQACSKCRQSALVRLAFGPYEMRRTA